MAAAFSGWRAHATEGAELRRRAGLLVSSLQQRLLRAAWNAWAEHGRAKQAAALLLQRALQGRAERSLNACFEAWRSAAQDSARRNQVLRQALGRLIQRHRSTAFAGWRQAAAQRQHRRRLVEAAISKMRGQQLADCFQAWQRWAEHKRQLDNAEHAVQQARQRCQLDACFGLWRASAHRHAAAKRCLAAIRLRQVRAAFSTWQAVVEDCRAEAAAAALAPKQLRRAFQQWHGALHLAQQKRQRLEKAASWAFGSSRQRAWKAWTLYVAHQRKKQAAQQRFQAGMLRRCLEAWREGVQAKQRLAVKQQHLQDLAARRLLAAVLTEWRWAAAAAAFLRRCYCARAYAAWAEKTAAAKVGSEPLLLLRWV